MKKRKVVLAACLAVALMAGCAGSGTSTLKTDKTNIFVSQEGQLSSTTVETYENQEYYDEAEWKKSLEDAVAEYNGVHGAEAVTLRSSSMGSGKASMSFDYATGADLAQFTADYEDTVNQVDSIQNMTVEEAGGQGLLDGVNFVNASDNKPVAKEGILEKGEAHVVILKSENPVVVQTEGKLLFASEGTTFQDAYTVQTAPGTVILISK